MTAPWMPPLIHPVSLRRQQRRDGGYDMVPAYSISEMEEHGLTCARAALEQAAKLCEAESLLGIDDERAHNGRMMAAAIMELAKEITP